PLLGIGEFHVDGFGICSGELLFRLAAGSVRRRRYFLRSSDLSRKPFVAVFRTCCLKGRGHAGELLRLVLPRRFGADVLFTPASSFMIVILQGLLRLLECGLGFLGGRGRERGLLA